MCAHVQGICTHLGRDREIGSLAGWTLGPWYNLSNIQKQQKQVGINKYFHGTVFFGKFGFVLNQKKSFGQINQSPKKSERSWSLVLFFFFWKTKYLQHIKTRYLRITRVKYISQNENKMLWHVLMIPLFFFLWWMICEKTKKITFSLTTKQIWRSQMSHERKFCSPTRSP